MSDSCDKAASLLFSVYYKAHLLSDTLLIILSVKIIPADSRAPAEIIIDSDLGAI